MYFVIHLPGPIALRLQLEEAWGAGRVKSIRERVTLFGHLYKYYSQLQGSVSFFILLSSNTLATKSWSKSKNLTLVQVIIYILQENMGMAARNPYLSDSTKDPNPVSSDLQQQTEVRPPGTTGDLTSGQLPTVEELVHHFLIQKKKKKKKFKQR